MEQKHRGVTFDKANNKYLAYIRIGGKSKNLGRFQSFDDAVQARLDAEKLYGNQVDKKTLLDLTDKQFGDLKVLREDTSQKRKDRYWIAECVCGRIKSYNQNNLTAKKTLSCGCSKRNREIIGKTFGFLEVLEDTNKTIGNGATLYLCRCECGTLKEYTSTQLVNKKVKSCGCKRDLHILQDFDEYKVDDVFVPDLTKKIGSNNKSGVKGVHFVKRGYWVADLTIKGQKFRKRFKDKADAIAQRKEWEEMYHEPYIEKLKEKDEDTD